MPNLVQLDYNFGSLPNAQYLNATDFITDENLNNFLVISDENLFLGTRLIQFFLTPSNSNSSPGDGGTNPPPITFNGADTTHGYIQIQNYLIAFTDTLPPDFKAYKDSNSELMFNQAVTYKWYTSPDNNSWTLLSTYTDQGEIVILENFIKHSSVDIYSDNTFTNIYFRGGQ